MRKPIDSALLLAICTALLYSWGTAYNNGYLRIINLDSDMMERSFHQVMYYGFIVSYAPIFYILFIVAMIQIFRLYLVSPYLSFKEKYYIIRAIENCKRFQLFLYLLLWFLLLLSLAYCQYQGKEQATNLINNHLTNKNNPHEMISVVIDKREKSLRHLGCGAQNCAGIEEGSNKIFYFPQSNGYSSIYIPENTTGASNE